MEAVGGRCGLALESADQESPASRALYTTYVCSEADAEETRASQNRDGHAMLLPVRPAGDTGGPAK